MTDISNKHLSARLKTVLDELEELTALLSTLSDEMMDRLLVQSGEKKPDAGTDFMSR